MVQRQALEGIRVADFCIAGVGPRVGLYLADFGAEVIKVETALRMEMSRASGFNFVYGSINQNKKSLQLNLKHPKGVELAKRLVSLSDVVAENMVVGAMTRFGLSYEELRKVKPDIIYISVSFAGQTGPYKGYRGGGANNQSLAGLNDLTGWPDRVPAAPAVAYTDFYSPPLWALAVVSALDYRRRTGKGQYIDGSILEAAVENLGTAYLNYVVNGVVETRRGNRHPYAAPHGVYRCQGEDRWCAIEVVTDEEWRSFCHVIGDPDWTKEKKFATILDRLTNAEELDRLVEEWTSRYTAEEVMSLMQRAEVAAGVVSDAKDLYQDPQLNHRHHYWISENPELKKFTFAAPSLRLSKTPPRFSRPHPRLGEHNEYVFTQLLGLSPEEYAQLVDESVIH